MVLTVSSEPARTTQMVDFLTKRHPESHSYLLFQTWEVFAPMFRPPGLSVWLLESTWMRAGLPRFAIGKP
jgi:hypothetical protein